MQMLSQNPHRGKILRVGVHGEREWAQSLYRLVKDVSPTIRSIRYGIEMITPFRMFLLFGTRCDMLVPLGVLDSD